MHPKSRFNLALVSSILIFLSVFCSDAQPVLDSPVVSPEVGPDRKVTFRFQNPNVKEVTVAGDFAPDGLPMTKSDKGVWSSTHGTLQPGVYGYYFRVDGVRLPDPGNLLISSGATLLKSYVEVPGDKPEFWSIRDVPHGALHENFYKSPTLKTTRRIVVYTPPGYNPTSDKTYPVIYLYHGSGDNETFWMKVGRANFIMDNLLADGKCKPALVVGCYGHSSVPPKPEGMGGSELYEVSIIEKDILENVIPLMEKEYHVGREGKDRAIAGLSMGGFQALTIGLNNYSKFSYVAGFSAEFRANQTLSSNFKNLLADPAKANSSLKLVWVGIGSQEGPAIMSNRRMDQFLSRNEIKHECVEIPGGVHSWVSWRGYFRDLMPRLFVEN